MPRNVCRSLSIALAACLWATWPASAAPPMHATKEPSVVSTARATYTIVQEDQDVGHESMTRRVFDNNTVAFEAEDVVINPAVTMTVKSQMLLEEESYFPRTYRAEKTIAQSNDVFVHTITVDMFANVAVLGSELRGSKDSRRVVVPSGTAIQEVGMLYPWYQLLFWMEPAGDERQRIQWLDPSSGAVDSGEMYFAGETTIDVLGKKTKVAVYKAERQRLGAATLYVDAKKRIVKAEQNMLTYRLDQWSEELAKK